MTTQTDLFSEAIARCSVCNRAAWETKDIATVCDFPQPDGSRCKGRFRPLLHYPRTPGYKAKASETSKQAAKAMRPRADTLREYCEGALKSHPMTADEIAAFIKESPLAIRPPYQRASGLGAR